ncbi:hypothetical protein ETH_00035960 [Eimeria tenella]|uniref:Uncharacterized protein n=1 Tax=Eimeria tenella TaxID=5802 RepID=U6L1P9_EIMTE|nr:hypothetical protein ETH_00035960 [Eimeria tenella]CDJ44332.1 hypothetical protein ETH_00035960 [Eimeria tenella]|eukprot:XP_013235081.1 hypothetical protein ETH_00035960 [Eimeria tenella]
MAAAAAAPAAARNLFTWSLQVRCLRDLAAMSGTELQELLGREEGRHLHAFLNATISVESLDYV